MGRAGRETDLRRSSAGALAALAGLAVWLAVEPGGENGAKLVSHVAQAAAAGIAGLVCWRVAGWRWLGVGAFAWGLGQAVYAVEEVAGAGEPSFPSLADAGFLALFPLAVTGLLLHPAAPRGRAAVARVLIDGLIAGGAVRFMFWTLVMKPLDVGQGTGIGEGVADLAYAMGDFVVVTVAVFVGIRALGRRRAALMGVGLAFAVLGVADGIFGYADMHGGYRTGGLVDLGWVAGFLVLALSARLDATVPAGAGLAAPSAEETLPRTLLLYVFVVPALVTGVADAGLTGDLDTSQFWNALVAGVLVLVRQVVDRVHNVRLVRSLERTVAELRERDSQLEEAQRLAHLGSWKWDLATDTITWTDEVYRIFGLTREEFTPSLTGYMEQIHPTDRARTTGFVEHAVETGEAFEFEHRIVGVEGRIVQCRGRAVMDGEGVFVQLVGTVQDVTTVRHLAWELERRLAELERSNADLAHFASVASHDLAAPVQLLLGHLRMLRDRTREELDLTNIELIEGAIRGAHRLEELIQDILDYSLATGGDDNLRSPVDVGRVVREAARMVGADHWAPRIEVEPLPTVEAHPGQIRQLFSNLLSNALKFVPPDREPEIRVWAEPLEGAWCFSVSDNGVGVSAEDRERIFQMFERGETVDVRGTGIGLAICARIVARHAGHIWVDPAAGGGSVFRFTLAGGSVPAPASPPALATTPTE